MVYRSVNKQTGLTLIEVLIVVILMGIIAAVAIPRFPAFSRDAQESTLQANLSALRKAIDQYAAQHNGRYPGQYDEADGTTPAATATDAQDAFVAQLTQYSNANGKTSPTPDATYYPFGPYFRQGVPQNPIPTPSSAVVADLTATGTPTGTGGGGWKYAAKTGLIIPNDPSYHDR